MTEVTNWNKKIIDEFRENEGRVGGPFEGAPMLILHTKGRKSEEPRENPMVYQAVGEDYAVFASKGGAPTNPDWYYNALANPEIEIELGTGRVPVKVRELTGDEREPVWTAQKQRMPGFAEYENATKGIREIPVLLLEPR